MEIPPPKNVNQMMTLQGQLQSIKHFISQLVDKAQPLTKALWKGVTYNWDEDCEQHLKQIKEYLSNPPILMPPIQDKPLILYISPTDTLLGELLAQRD